MLNLNNYVNLGIVAKIKELWQGRFKYGVNMTGLAATVGRFENGNYKVAVAGPTLTSIGTGHWPFSIFNFVIVTGDLMAAQLAIMGFTFGTKLVPDVGDDGTISGPDYRTYYWLFSCLNHRDQILEEIIN